MFFAGSVRGALGDLEMRAAIMSLSPDPTNLQLLFFDVDGVLTDGAITYHEDGSESKNFHTSDGLGLRAAMQAGLKVVIVTARQSKLVERRMTQLGVDRLVQGCKDKRSRVAELADEFGVPLTACGYLGDDLVDLGAMDAVGYPMAVADAAAELREMSAFVCTRPGGRGAAREAVEHVLKTQGKWAAVVEAYRG